MTEAPAASPWRAWMLAARPRTLPAAVAPVLVGSALAWANGAFSLFPALAALLCTLLIQVGANLANDYFDYVKGVDIAGRKGPTRAAQSGLISLPHLRLGIIAVFSLASLVGLCLVVLGGWPILIVGIASLISALVYTGGPFPIGYHGLGDLFVFLFFGFAGVCGTYYVQAQRLEPVVTLAAVPVGSLITAILVVNNLRDIDTDRRTGKRTLAVIIGARATRLEYLLLLFVAYLIPAVLVLGDMASAWVLLPWLTLPWAVRLARHLYQTDEGPRLNRTLAGTASLSLLFSIAFSMGLVL